MELKTIGIILGATIVVALLLLAWLYFTESLWLRAFVSRAPVNPLRIILMKVQKLNPKTILELKIRAALSKIKLSTSRLETFILESNEADVTEMLEAAIMGKQAGVDIDMAYLHSFKLSGGDVKLLVDAKILADKADLEVTMEDLARHHLAKGDIKRVVQAMIIAYEADIKLFFDRAAAIDLAGRDILEAVKMRVQPKVIKTPEPVTAMAKDGIQVTANARVTVKMDLDRLIGGAGEDTILARVGEGIVRAIGSAENHKELLEDPSSISKKIWAEDLEEGTAFNILSVDIADLDVGKNIGAKLQKERAEADTKIAQAQAEKKEQEMRVKILEMKARLLEEEAKVPSAMAEAFKRGRLGVMDFYRMKNLRADTDMRDSIALSQKGSEEEDMDEMDEKDE